MCTAVSHDTHRLSRRLCSLLKSLCFSLYVFCSSARRTRYSTSTASNMSTDILPYSWREERKSATFYKPIHFQLWVITTFVFILRAPPSSASSCTSCRGPAFWADQCATASRWPPTKSVCSLPEDSPDPLMSHLVRKQRILKHKRNFSIRIYSNLFFVFISTHLLYFLHPPPPNHLLTLVQADVLHLLLGHLAKQGHPLQRHHL